MNYGYHTREFRFRGRAETMTSNDATWDTTEARGPKKPRVQSHSGAAHCGLTSKVRSVDNRISRNCITDEPNAIDAR